MKKSVKIGLGITVIIFAIILSLIIWQWGNISAIYMGVVSSEEKIEEEIQKNKDKLAQQLQEDGLINPKAAAGLSKEDEEKIAKGELTVDEAVEKLFAPEEEIPEEVNQEEEIQQEPQTPTNADVPPEEEKEPEQQPGNVQQDDSKIKEKQLIETAVKKMYSLKAEYVQQLAAIESSAKLVFYKGEQTRERKLEIAENLLPQFIQAERTCDGQVEAILEELNSGLNALGANTSVVQAIRDQYNNEKQLQKSKYVSKYL